jgi:phosphoribosyl 1,2-cyclic phosphodiesterase
MRFASLGSGSEGNGLVVESGGTRILIDCGFGVRDTASGSPGWGSSRRRSMRFSSRTSMRPYRGRPRVRRAVRHSRLGDLRHAGCRLRALRGNERVYGFDSHERFAIGALEIQPVTVPHDAREPVQYVVGDGAHRVGVLTDIGMSHGPRRIVPVGLRRARARVQSRSRRCSRDGDYPVLAQAADRLPLRPSAQRGAAEILGRIDTSRLVHIIAAHLSRENNTPELASLALATALNCQPHGRHREPVRRIRLARDVKATRERQYGNRCEPRRELYKGRPRRCTPPTIPLLVMHYRDDVSAFDGVKLAQARAKGRDQQQDQRYVMGGSRRRHSDAFRPLLNERESLVKAMKMIPVECVVRNVCAGSMAKRYGIEEGSAPRAHLRVLPQERRAARSAVQRGSHSRSGMGDPRRHPQMKKLTHDVNAVLKPLFAGAASTSSTTSSSSGIRSTIPRAADAGRRIHAGRCRLGTRRPARSSTRTVSAAISAA